VNFRTLCLSLMLPLALLSQGAHAQDAAPVLTPVQQMAEILATMKDHPTKEQKKALEALANSSAVTDHVRNMAGVIKNMKGRVQTSDKPRLYSVFRAVSAAEAERELAKIINKFNGKADPTLLSRLNKLLPPKPKADEKAEGEAGAKEEQKQQKK